MVDRLNGRRHRSPKLWPVFVIRVYAGIVFANAGIAKIGRDFAESMSRFLSANLDESFSFYRPFIESVVLPNRGVFAVLVAWGELAIGIALILGLATRYAAFVGVFMVVNFWFAKGASFLAASNHDLLWMFVLLMLGAVQAGRIGGLDAVLSERMRFLR